MSSDDRVRPYHAKPDASGQEAADAVAAVLKHAAERDASAQTKAPPRKQPKWMLPLGINLAVFAVYLLIAPPPWVTVSPIKGPPVAQQERSLRATIWVKAQMIDGFQMANGRLPATLDEVGGPALSGVDYVPGDSEYQLVAQVGEAVIVYDSANPDPDFAQSMSEGMQRAGG